MSRILWFILLISPVFVPMAAYCGETSSRTFVVEISPTFSSAMASDENSEHSSFSAALSAQPQLTISHDTLSTDPAPRQRKPELSEDQLLIVGLDKSGAEIMRSLILDPRIVRSESVDAAGHVSSTTLFQNQASFAVTFPNDDRLAIIEIYHPVWDGKQFTLQFQGDVSVATMAEK